MIQNSFMVMYLCQGCMLGGGGGSDVLHHTDRSGNIV